MTTKLPLTSFDLEERADGKAHHNQQISNIVRACINPDITEIEIDCRNNPGGAIASFVYLVSATNYAITNGKKVTISFTRATYSCAALFYVYALMKDEIEVKHNDVELIFHTAQITVHFETVPKEFTMEKFEEYYHSRINSVKESEHTVRSLYEHFIKEVLNFEQNEIEGALIQYDQNENMAYNVFELVEGEMAYEAV
ncbi:hypothetical protein C4G66_RS24340 [Vibrio parahaemolyticus]|nr:hypothetical protein [Vibrio parahaemolyticus]EJG1072039.1 hypothetical protein [Vibrio parahaemolyticus]HCG9740613.1 hypothetical protein [Vibrio parahaemolyticus]